MDGSAMNGFAGTLPEEPVVLGVLYLSRSRLLREKWGP